MRLQEQYQIVLEIKPQINDKLKDLNFQRIKELILWLAKSEKFQKVKKRDNQLSELDRICKIWMEEKRKLTSRAIDDDIFRQVDSLEALEQKYLTIQYGILRIETPMPEEYYQQVVEDFISYGVSGVALCLIAIRETEKAEQNILKIAELLKESKQYISAIELLQCACETFQNTDDFLLQLADCWMDGQMWQQAYDCLKKIEKPDAHMKQIMKELKKVL